jgi:hypothetical protein
MISVMLLQRITKILVLITISMMQTFFLGLLVLHHASRCVSCSVGQLLTFVLTINLSEASYEMSQILARK